MLPTIAFSGAVFNASKIMKKVGLVKKKFLTRERLYLIVDYLLRHEKQGKWTRSIRNERTEFMKDVDRNVDKLLWGQSV